MKTEKKNELIRKAFLIYGSEATFLHSAQREGCPVLINGTFKV